MTAGNILTGMDCSNVYGVHYTNQIEQPNGTYGPWFVPRDNTSGHTGTVTTALRLE